MITPALFRLRVLVVDDHADLLDSMAAVLTMLGHDVQTAARGVDALSIVQRWRPHIAFVDVGMPDMSGYEIAHHVRTVLGGPQPMLVALTGWGRERDKVAAINAGFDQHLIKPLEFSELLSLLAAVPAEGEAPRGA